MGGPTTEHAETQKDPSDAEQGGAASFDRQLRLEVDRYIAAAPMDGLRTLRSALAELLAEAPVAWPPEPCDPPIVEQETKGGVASTSPPPLEQQQPGADTFESDGVTADLPPLESAWKDLQEPFLEFRETTREALEQRLDELLAQLPNGHFGSLERNRHFIRELNQFLDQGGWTLLAPDNQPARLRIVRPRRGAETGNFALKYASGQKMFKVPDGVDTTNLKQLIPKWKVAAKAATHRKPSI
jgi:hypothetical protein